MRYSSGGVKMRSAGDGREKRNGRGGQKSPPGDAHHTNVTRDRDAGAADAAEFIGPEERRRRGSGIAREQGGQLNQASAADDGVDESGGKGGAQHERQGRVASA